jgi:hypothetical protein
LSTSCGLIVNGKSKSSMNLKEVLELPIVTSRPTTSAAI